MLALVDITDADELSGDNDPTVLLLLTICDDVDAELLCTEVLEVIVEETGEDAVWLLLKEEPVALTLWLVCDDVVAGTEVLMEDRGEVEPAAELELPEDACELAETSVDTLLLPTLAGVVDGTIEDEGEAAVVLAMLEGVIRLLLMLPTLDEE